MGDYIDDAGVEDVSWSYAAVTSGIYHAFSLENFFEVPDLRRGAAVIKEERARSAGE